MTNEKIRVKANRIVVKLRSLELKALLAEYHADSHTHNTDKKMKQQALYTASMALSSIQNDIQDIIDEIQDSVREFRKDN